ncbi:hypothetical protein B296_00057749 [Ensete ventricosum]|uniref:Uncharacterized protein n=1 Tax=Ensete ventricosum TaxID=4639 RepID=A0A426WWU2_ENSVE|nr:hypothetical protein B296_00057749 [Ensete ventricosum]
MVSRMSMVSQKNVTVINFAQSHVSIDFSYTVSEIQNTVFPILLAHGKSYKLAFAKNYDGQKFARSRALSRVSIGFS